MRLTALIIFFALGLIAAQMPPVLSAENVHRLHLSENTITAHIDQLPIQVVLERIAAYGIVVKIDPSISHTVTARLNREPMAEGLRRLFSPLSYSIVWSSIETPAGPISKVTEIHVFQPGTPDSPALISGPDNFDIIADRDTGTLLIRGEVLLRIKPGTQLNALKALLGQFNAVVIDHHAGAGILRLRMADHEQARAFLDALSSSGIDAAAEPHYAYRLPSLAAGVQQHSTAKQPPSPFTGTVPVAILDSGLAAESLPSSITLAPYNAIDSGADVQDRVGHGTHMALIASGRVAPVGTDPLPETGVSIIPVKIFDENGYTSNFTVMRALAHAMENGAKVISLSWGSETDSAFLRDVLTEVGAAGALLLAASGYAPTGKPVFPAAYPSVVGVGDLAPDGTVWESSNRGSFVALYAPGQADFDGSDQEPAGVFAGTSVATAYTAYRLASFLAANPGAGIKAFLSTTQ